MRDQNRSINAQSGQDSGMGIVILIQDRDRISPQEDAKKLSAETGYPIVKRGFNDTKVKSSKPSSKHKKPHTNAQKMAKRSTKSDSAVANIDIDSQWQLVYTSDGLALRLSNEPSW